MTQNHFHPDPLKRKIPQALVDAEVFEIQAVILESILKGAQSLLDKKTLSYLKGEELKRNMRQKVESNLNALDNTWASTKTLFEKAEKENKPFDAVKFYQSLKLYDGWRTEVMTHYKKVSGTPIPVSDVSRKVLKRTIHSLEQLLSYLNLAKEKYFLNKQTQQERVSDDSL